MANRLMVLAAMLALVLAAAAPAVAQEEAQEGYQYDVAPPDPNSAGVEEDLYSTLTFELAVEGEPPAGTEFFGAVSGEGGSRLVPLADPDGDRTYTGSTESLGYLYGGEPGAERIPVEVPVRILQGSEEMAARYPADPGTVIKDFGFVSLGGDRTFEASVSFGGGSTTPISGGGTTIGGGTTMGGGATTAAVDQYEDGGTPEQAGIDLNEDGAVDETDGQFAVQTSDQGVNSAPEEGALPGTGGLILPIAGFFGAALLVGGLLYHRKLAS